MFPGLGLAPVYVDAHAEEDRWAELRTLRDRPVGYGLTRDGGLAVEGAGRGARLTPFGTAAPKFFVQGGKS